MSQLEFLKIIGSLFASVGARAVLATQIIFTAVHLVYLSTSFSPLIGHYWSSLGEKFSSTWTVTLGVLDLLLQCWVLYFVLWRMPSETAHFRRQYSAIVAAGVGFLLAGATLEQFYSSGSSPERGCVLLCVVGFALLSIRSMQILRSALTAGRYQSSELGNEASHGLVFALVTIVWLSAIASLVSIRKLPVSLYTTLIRISLCLTTFHVAARTCYLYISQLQTLIVSFLVGLVLYISIMLFLIAEVTFLAIIAPFASGITPGVLWSVRTLIMLIALGIGFNTLSNFYDKYWYDLAKQVAYVFTLIGAIYEVFQQFFLLYFVIWKLKHAPMSFRIKYAGACGLAVTIMAASAWCNGLRLDYPRPRRLAAYAFADAFILCALLCMQLVRSSLQLESHAVSASTSPHDVLQSKLPGVPLRQKKILRTDMAIKLSRTQLETQIESRRPSKTLADMNQTQ